MLDHLAVILGDFFALGLRDRLAVGAGSPANAESPVAEARAPVVSMVMGLIGFLGSPVLGVVGGTLLGS